MIVKKLWGSEDVLVNSPLYCAKILRIDPGMGCSYHRHRIKDETFFVLSGEVVLKLGERVPMLLKHGSSQHVPPMTYHSFGSESGAVMLEVSTHHEDSDVERLTESGPFVMALMTE